MTYLKRSWRLAAAICLVAAGAYGAPQDVEVYVEDSPAAQDLLLQAQQLRDQGRLAQAVAVYQQIIDDHARKLMRVEPGLFADAAVRIHQEIAWHIQLLDAYRRLQQPAAAGLLAGLDPTDTSARSEVVRRYALTPAGLEAGLDLAALFLEQARIDDAGVVLDSLADHPDLAADASRWHVLQSAAGLFGIGDDRLATHRRSLTDPAQLELLDQWVDARRPPPDLTAGTPHEPLAAQSWPDVPRQPLWTVTTAAHGRAGNTIQVQPGRPNLLAHVTVKGHADMQPVVVDDRLYLNDAMSITAVDRFSGRGLWTYKPTDLNDSINEAQFNRRLLASTFAAARSVAVAGDVVAAVVGRASPMRRVIAGLDQRTWLVCLSRDDGRLRWRVAPNQIDDTLAAGFFHGTPVVRDGRVFALLWRGQMQGFHSTYIAAIDVRTGEVLWRRHLLSSAIGRGQSIQAHARMIYHQGKLFAVDNIGLGAAACLSARTGEIRWLTLPDDPNDPAAPAEPANRRIAGRRLVTPTSPGAPVLCKAGFIVRTTTGANLIDPATGRIVRRLDDAAWSHARFMLRCAQGVITVGKHVRLFDGKTLRLRWTQQLSTADLREPRGRPVVTQKHIILPLVKQLLILNLDDGVPAKRVDLDTPGGVLVLDDQLITAGMAKVNGYMHWNHAQAQLQRRIKDNPRDPHAALNLAHLALMSARHDALLAAIDSATTAAADSPVLQQRVFEHIRALVDPQGAADVPMIDQWRQGLGALDAPMRRQLFDRMLTAARRPHQVVAYHLAQGRFLQEQGDMAGAVAQYQAILLDAALAPQDVAFGTGSRQAGLEATLRLTAIVRRAGPGVYSAFDTEAREQLAAMRAGDGLHVDALINLARAYPMSNVAPQARADAADLLINDGRLSEAIIQLRRAAGETRQPAVAARVIGRLAEVHLQKKQPGRARRLLERAQRERPGLMPLRAGAPTNISQWIAELADRTHQENHLPRLALPLGEPRRVDGRLLVARAQARRAWPDDLCVILVQRDEDRFDAQLLAGPALKPAWTTAVPAGDMQLLSLSREQALLWSPKTTTLLAIETPTGRVAWRVDEMAAQISRITGDPLNAQLRRFRRSLNPDVVRLRHGKLAVEEPRAPAGHVVVANDLVVCIGDHAGRFIALDQHTGQILWRERLEMEQLRDVALGDQWLAVAGSTPLPDHRNSVAGNVIILDPLTGQKTLPIITDAAQIDWVGFSEAGTFLYANASTLFARRINDGELVWRYQVGAKGVFWNAIVTDAHVLVADAVGSLTMLDLDHGQPLGSVVRPGPTLSAQSVQQRRLQMHAAGHPVAFANGVQVQTGGQHWHLLSPQAAEARSMQGNLLWQDAISMDVKNLVLQHLGEKLIAVVNNASIGARRAYSLYILDRFSGAILDECDLPVDKRSFSHHAAVMLDQAMVLTDGRYVVIVPGAE